MRHNLEIQNYVNHKNKELWDLLSRHYRFELYYDSKESTWLVHIKNDVVSIISNETKVNRALFSHELLHVYMDYLNFPATNKLKQELKGNLSFSLLANNYFLSQVHNYLAHVKMYPEFIKMGYKPHEFLSTVPFFKWKQRWKMKQSSLKEMSTLRDYVGISLSFLCFEPELHKVRTKRNQQNLCGIAPVLFDILSDFISEWRLSGIDQLLGVWHHFDKQLDEYLTGMKR